MKDFQLQTAKAFPVVKRKDGTFVKSFAFHADELKGWIIEIAALDKQGNLHIMVAQPKKKI